MLNGQRGVTFRNVGMLFDEGVIGGLSDRQLLERFEQRGTDGSELAFATLVTRHGPMVLRVCRSVLRDPNDAHDAFQATFLVLVRRAGSLRVRDSLAPWLYQVARRTAACMRSAVARRRRHEAAASQQTRLTADAAQPDDLVETLAHEVGRLPDRYRIVIELCLLQGLTHRQAAEHLGWPVGTVESRLARAKERLRDRLKRRGIVPSMVLSRAALNDGAALVPPALVAATIHTAARCPGDGVAASRSVTELVNRVLATFPVLRATLALTSALLVALAVAAAVYGATRGAGQIEASAPVQGEPARQQPRPIDNAEADRTTLIAPTGVRARAGRGTLLLYALDEHGARIDLGGALKETSEAHRWVAVTGVLDHRAIRALVGDQPRPQKDFLRILREYRRAEVERQHRRAGGEWSAWSPVDRAKTCGILRNVPELAEELTPSDVRPAALVDPLPFLKVGAWEGVNVEQLIPRDRIEVPKAVAAPRPVWETYGPEVMVRSLDFAVEPRTSYRYRGRIIMDGSDGTSQRREVIGPWSEPTAPVQVPE